ncbi:MAG TPA: hypothetical protein VFY27_11875 [Woeseiaceae bacterium]|nr:hypothetical protein [Woeseiaceae bacterium]
MPQNRFCYLAYDGTVHPVRTGRLAACSLLVGMLFSGSAIAEPTDITIRVVARGAMYVGDLVEGAQVTLTDAGSGEVLAQGVTEGAAGDPERIMEAARKRGAPMSAPGDAQFSATIDIDEPRYLQVTAFGPLQRRESATRTTMTQWVVPGKHLTGGDGWVLELAGFFVQGDLESSFVSLEQASEGVLVEAEVALMCGCPVKPGFFWDADNYEVTALVKRGEAEVGRYPLRYAGSASDFAGSIAVELPGLYDITVYAHDPASGNTGVDRLELTVSE